MREGTGIGYARETTREVKTGATRLLVMVAVVSAILCAIVVAFYSGLTVAQNRAGNLLHAATELSGIRFALERFHRDVGRFPTVAEGLDALAKPIGQGPYLKSDVLIDPWGKPYIYSFAPGQRNVPEISTLGRDGAAGGSGDDGDMTVWPLSP